MAQTQTPFLLLLLLLVVVILSLSPAAVGGHINRRPTAKKPKCAVNADGTIKCGSGTNLFGSNPVIDAEASNRNDPTRGLSPEKPNQLVSEDQLKKSPYIAILGRIFDVADSPLFKPVYGRHARALGLECARMLLLETRYPEEEGPISDAPDDVLTELKRLIDWMSNHFRVMGKVAGGPYFDADGDATKELRLIYRKLGYPIPPRSNKEAEYGVKKPRSQTPFVSMPRCAQREDGADLINFYCPQKDALVVPRFRTASSICRCIPYAQVDLFDDITTHESCVETSTSCLIGGIERSRR